MEKSEGVTYCTCTADTVNVVTGKLRMSNSPHGKRVAGSRLKVPNCDGVRRTGFIHSTANQSI